MTDDEQLEQALAELGDMVQCRCDEAYRDRDLQDPECNCDSMDAVRVVIARVEWLERERREAALDALAAMGQAQEAYEAQLKAEAKVEALERERVLDAKLLADTQALLDTALEAVIDAKLAAEAKVQALEAERDAALAALEESGRKRGETLALLDKAVVAMREASSFLWHMTNAIDDEDYKGPHDGFNVPLVCHVQPYHDLHVEQLKTQAEKVDAVLAEIEGRVVPGLRDAAERTKGMLVERRGDAAVDALVKRLCVAAQDMVTVARQDGWAEATTGRQLVLRSVQDALAAFREGAE